MPKSKSGRAHNLMVVVMELVGEEGEGAWPSAFEGAEALRVVASRRSESVDGTI